MEEERRDGNSGRLAYSIAELASACGVSRSQLYLCIANRELQARKKGRRTVILADEARRFLNDLPDWGEAR